MFATVDHLDGRDFLSEWNWLLPEPMVAVRVTALGDVFCADKNGIVHFLDTRWATLQKVGEGEASIDRLLDDAGNRRTFLLSFFVRMLRHLGMKLAPGQCYSFRHPIHLGGEMSQDNVDMIDVGVHLAILGQLHRQTK